MYQSSFQLPLSQAGMTSQSNADQITVANQKAAAAAAGQGQYKQIPLSDGGFGFVDPNGKQISASEYAAAKGMSITDVLKNSQNPIDIGHAKDFQDLQNYINNKLIASTNPTAKIKVQNVEQQVQKTYGVNIAKFTPAQLIQQFQHAYPTVYGLQNTGVLSGQVFIPPSQI